MNPSGTPHAGLSPENRSRHGASSAEWDWHDVLASTLAWWDEAGVDTPSPPARSSGARDQHGLPGQSGQSGQVSRAASARPHGSGARTPPRAASAVLASIGDSASVAQAASTLFALKAAIEGFNWGELRARASQIVFARGNPEAKIMIIGESPGLEEDEAGAPFMGPSGQLLTRMLGAIGLDDEAVYITNVIKFRTLGNMPAPEELELCKPFIARHVELIKPELIILVGGVSLQVMTGQTGITKLRGQWQDYAVQGHKIVPALPLYHPAFLIRRPELKAEAWRDLLALKARIAALV